MTNYQIVDALILLLALCGVVYFFYGPWQKLLVDVIRQQLFELRDSVFDLALSNDISFESDEYKSYRSYMNSLIRHAHSATFLHYFVLGIYASKILKIKVKSDFSESSFFQNKLLKSKFDKACGWIAVLMWLRSPFLMTLSSVVFLSLPIVVIAVAIGGKGRNYPKFAMVKFKKVILSNAELNAESDDLVSV